MNQIQIITDAGSDIVDCSRTDLTVLPMTIRFGDEEYFYDDSNIMAIISRLRKKLEVNPSSPKYIQTVKGIGYRFNKEV